MSERVRSHVSFQAFALDRGFPIALAEEVLGSVSSTVTTITYDGHDNLHVFLIVCENLFESIAQVVEVGLL